ncbi:AraC family transcriptional regulator [Pyxidicoccus trucidator]|uniref:AraC family transcriptional regulator n=1 Tax=Pyxidicoccus trucidator TaxID=2709662 RepID=UPI0013DB72FF|nr:AraC family transcriptional regulator [Pyxidicoccus trucidator]
MLPDLDLLSALNAPRRVAGLLTIEEVLALASSGNVIFDPFSVLISRHARIGQGNVFHPCVTLTCAATAELRIGNRNTFHTGTLLAAETGPISMGDGNQFGEGGFTAKANSPGARIVIGDGGRYLGGASIFGQTELGSGTQVLGAITVEGCSLAGGAAFSDPDPDRRAAVLKGAGTARRLVLGVGQVIAGSGTFRLEDAKPQSFFHPKAAP